MVYYNRYAVGGSVLIYASLRLTKKRYNLEIDSVSA